MSAPGGGTGRGQVDLSTVMGININPMTPPNMRTLVYAPDVQVFIAHGDTQYDISRDIVEVQMVKCENSASTVFVTLSNKGGRWTKGVPLLPMDRITVFMKRFKWIQTFSGYLDTVPFRQLYQGVVTIKATCTLKRLLHTQWNPGLPQSARLFDQLSKAHELSGTGQLPYDSGLGGILADLLTKVGGWDKTTIHIANFPMSFYAFLVKQAALTSASGEAASQAFKHLLLGDDISPGAKNYVNYNTDAGSAGPRVVGQEAYVTEIIAACDELGMGPNTTNLNTAQYMETAMAEGQAGLASALDSGTKKAWETTGEAGTAIRAAAMNQDAAILGVACAMAVSGLMNKANLAVPESVPLGDGSFGNTLDRCGLFQQPGTPEWGCLPGWAQVFTSLGPKRIDAIKVDDLVWADDGSKIRLRRVEDQALTGYKPLVTVKTRGRTVECTPDHRIPVMRYFGRSDGRRVGECGWERIILHAQDIRKGDHLIVPHGMRNGERTTDPDGNTLSVKIMELVGLYLGDGNLNKHKDYRGRYGQVQIAHGVGGIYDDHMAHYRQSIRELGSTPYVSKRGTATYFSSPFFYTLLANHFPGNCYTKRLPEWVFELTPELQMALLRGYLDSDGSVDKQGRVSWHSVSEDLIIGLWHLCIQLGIPVNNISKYAGRIVQFQGQKPYQGADHWELRCSVPSSAAQIGSNSPHKEERLNPERKALKSIYDPDWNPRQCHRAPLPPAPHHAVYHRVISVSPPTEEVFPVYNLTVEEDHNYCANGVIVMNSLGQRMNPRQSAHMFFLHLQRINWINTDPGQAIYQVQKSGSPALYSGFVEAAKALVTPIREAKEGAASTIASNPITGSLSSIAGAVGFDVASTVRSATNAVTTTPTVNGVRSQLGKPVPDSEGAVMTAYEQLGTPYVWGGHERGGFDCSGLFNYCFRAIGKNIGGWTGEQVANGTPVSPANVQRGDLMFFGLPSSPEGGHVVMWLGDGTVIHAPNQGDVVKLSSAASYNPYLATAIRRYAENGGPDPTAPRTDPMLAGPGVSPSTGGISGSAGGAVVKHDEQIARNLFGYTFTPAQYLSDVAVMWGQFGGHKDFIDSQPLIQMIQAVCGASMRNFQSAPNGDFIAYYPDYFGLEGKQAVMRLEDIELKDVHINFSDDQLTTHVYIAGDHTMAGQEQSVLGWLQTAGVASVEDEWLFARLSKVGLGDLGSALSGAALMARYGVRPYQASVPMAGKPELELLLAAQIFMEKWAAQYETRVAFTFMPELLPGMRVVIGDHNLQVYVREVHHMCSYEHGFSTEAIITAPSNPEGQNSMATATSTATVNPTTGLLGGMG